MSVPGRYLLAAACGASVLAAGVWACLPELAPLGPATAAAYCGNGVIDRGADGGTPEQCDPGVVDAGIKGCSAICTVECPSGGFVDERTGHCYYLKSNSATYEEAKTACRNEGAHVVTFVSDEEYRRVSDWYGALRGGENSFWVGLEGQISPPASFYYVASNGEEPGFGIPDASTCTGCFGKTPAGSPYFLQIAPDAGQRPTVLSPCVVSSKLATSVWFQSPCTAVLQTVRGVICEREPAGSRSAACEAGLCMEHPSTTKKYLYVSTEMTASAAESYCAKLPSGSLVMFDSREEREEIGRELAHAALRSGTLTFWIGLSKAADAWVWDDKKAQDQRPDVWGNHEPKAAPNGARAFVQLVDAYDTTLAHAEPGASASRPFLCQYR